MSSPAATTEATTPTAPLAPLSERSTLAETIFHKMNDGGMRNWVGNGDAGGIGRENARLIKHHINPQPGCRVLDFGCGIGRTAVGLVEMFGDAINVVGTDIIPKLVDFCHDEIEPVMPNTEFHLFNVLNEHYSHHYGSKDKDNYAAGESDEAQFFASHKGMFDLFVAFSVFTHLYDFDAKKYLQHAASSITDNGSIMCTFFVLDDESIANLRAGNAPFTFFNNRDAKDSEFFFGHTGDKLGFVGVPEKWIRAVAKECGLYVHKIAYGMWRLGHFPGTEPAETFQDIVVLRKLRTLPADFDEVGYHSHNKEVFASATGAAWHYLRMGREENRRYKSETITLNKDTLGMM